jgi:hypothetical protein
VPVHVCFAGQQSLSAMSRAEATCSTCVSVRCRVGVYVSPLSYDRWACWSCSEAQLSTASGTLGCLTARGGGGNSQADTGVVL